MGIKHWFENTMRGRTDGAYSCELVDTTSDAILAVPSRGLEVEVDGLIEVLFEDDTVPVIRPIKAGEIRPFNVKQIIAAGTDAAEVAVYR